MECLFHPYTRLSCNTQTLLTRTMRIEYAREMQDKRHWYSFPYNLTVSSNKATVCEIWAFYDGNNKIRPAAKCTSFFMSLLFLLLDTLMCTETVPTD
ncbi:hypothetical protein Ciccas_010021 [Cichlidogyrus casuarinus]|uniref:Lipocalin n=1 Tax=Cichlidogyrus casuarinus TaxID=1844966 RepID=A0ABD2PY61_9PLAT